MTAAIRHGCGHAEREIWKKEVIFEAQRAFRVRERVLMSQSVEGRHREQSKGPASQSLKSTVFERRQVLKVCRWREEVGAKQASALEASLL
jgi:hypothetical protein